MKRIILMALLALALPMAAFANGSGFVDFTNQGGTVSFGADGLTLGSSNVIFVDGLGNMGMITGPSLGSLSFTTGALTSGSVAFNSTGATFAAGGTFVITGNGSNGLPNGVIFSGTFTKPLELEATGVSGLFILVAKKITGTFSDGTTGVGGFSLVVNISKSGTISINSGDTAISTVPEPGTLGLMGTGLIGLAGALRRKLKA